MITITKKTTLLARPAIAQTSDGKMKVMSATDGGQSAVFRYGNEWRLEGEGLFESESEDNWAVDEVTLVPTAGGTTYSIGAMPASDGKSVQLLTYDEEHPVPHGSYPDAKVLLKARRGETTETLTIPINLLSAESAA